MKQKAFFIIFKGLSSATLSLRPERGPLNPQVLKFVTSLLTLVHIRSYFFDYFFSIIASIIEKFGQREM